MPRKPATTRPEPSDDQSTAPEAQSTQAPTADAPSADEPPAAESAAAAGATPGHRFFSWLRTLDLRREPGWIGGVCAGIAARLGIDPLIVRGIAVVVAVLGGPALLLYAAAWLLLPDSDDRIHLEEVVKGRFEPAIAGIGAMVVLTMLPLAQGFWFTGAAFWGEPAWGSSIGRALWTAVLIGLLIWFVVWIARRSSTTPTARSTDAADGPAAPGTASSASFVASESTVSGPDAPPVGTSSPDVAAWREQQARLRAEQAEFRRHQGAERAAANRAAADRARAARAEQRQRDLADLQATRSHPLYSLTVIGLALVAGGLATVLVSNGQPTPLAAVVGLSSALVVLALGIIVNGVRGKRSGGASGLAWVLLVPLLFTSIATAGGTPTVAWGPVRTLEPTGSEEFAVGAGRVILDLTDVETAERPSGIDGADVSLRVGAGDVTVLVPEGMAVVFTGTVGAGDIEAGSDAESSRVGPVENVSAEFGDVGSGDPVVSVSVQLGAGRVAVIEEGARR
ncbi:PspC domain-containing protein [Salinibacterium soli]|uniref:PspC domain-containing protein n=1 Tax=Antiquaquibacter soli TaxID=3064523 RepID=A0ABT9BIR2_9MICO|nr:PspC domain-containing protein [Protaetiibacter sp. WY-16]MDO7880919.1 PspC domain-containing protein [Protaetiibacter sp. WY-16]